MAASGDTPVLSTDCYVATHAQLQLCFVRLLQVALPQADWQHAAGPGGDAQPIPLRSSFPSAQEAAALLGALSA